MVAQRSQHRYAIQKASLSPEQRTSLELVEDDIASNPDPERFENDGLTYEFSDEFVSVAFRRTGRNDGELVSFKFYADA